MTDTTEAATASTGTTRRGTYAATLLVILALAAVLRIYGLGDKALWLDEVMSLRLATQPTFGDMLTATAAYDAHPPLFAAVQFVWMRPQPMRWLPQGIRWGGDPNLRVDGYSRVPSVLFGLAAVAVMALLAEQFYGRRLGLVAAGLLAVSAYHVYFSQEARPYALLVLLTLGLTYAFLRLLRAGDDLPWLWVLAYVVLAVACLYTFLLSLLVLVSHGLIFLWVRRRDRRALLVAGAAVLVVAFAFLPWYPTLRALQTKLGQAVAVNGAMPLGPAEMVQAFGDWTFGPLALSSGGFPWSGAAALLLLALAGAATARENRNMRLLAALILIPLALYLVLPMPRVHAFESKHLIFLMPLCLLLLVGALQARRGRHLVPVLLALIALVNLAELYVYLDPTYQKERWPDVCRFINEQGRAGDVIVINPRYAAFVFQYYYRGSLPYDAAPPPDAVAAGLQNIDAAFASRKFTRLFLVNCESKVSAPSAAVNEHFARLWPCDDEVVLAGHLGACSVRIFRFPAGKEGGVTP